MKNTGIADIALVIDTSGSMTGVFTYLMKNLENGIKQIAEGAKNFKEFDIRVGIIAGDKGKFFIIPFTNDSQTVFNGMQKIMEERTRSDEIMCFGIDLALCDLKWRPEAKRFLVMITDEELKTNHKPKYQREGITSGKLRERIEKMGVIFHFITPHKCHDYKQLEVIDKALWHPIEHNNELENPEKIQEIFGIIIKSISKSLSIPIGQPSNEAYNQHIYDFPQTKIELL